MWYYLIIMAEVFKSKRAKEEEQRQAEYARFDRYIDDEKLPRALAIAAFIDEKNYLDDRPDEVHG